MTNMTVQRRTASNVLYSSSYANYPPAAAAAQPPAAASASFSNEQLSKGKVPYYLQNTPIAQQLFTTKNSKQINLPTQWNDKDRCELLGLARDKQRVLYQGTGKTDTDAGAVRSNFPIPPQCGIYYFEIEIVNKGRDGYVSIGFCTQSVSLKRLPGWEMNSWGYHGDDGNMFASSGTGKPYGPTFTTGDVIGCCINLITKTAFYTKNGVSLGVAFRDLKDGLYPCVGLRTPGEVVEANFGSKKFRFDIELYIRDEKEALFRKINIEHPLKVDLTVMIKDYLLHHGYADTVKALTDDGSVDEDVSKRKHVRQLLSDGLITEAIEFIQYHYPNLLATNEKLKFCLDCRRFLEMIRNLNQQMVLDDLSSEWMQVIEAGQTIFKEYSHDQLKLEKLKEYSVLFTRETSDLYNNEQLETDISLVNVAILEYQAKSPNSLIEKLIKQAVVTRECMVEQDFASAAIANPLEFLPN